MSNETQNNTSGQQHDPQYYTFMLSFFLVLSSRQLIWVTHMSISISTIYISRDFNQTIILTPEMQRRKTVFQIYTFFVFDFDESRETRTRKIRMHTHSMFAFSVSRCNLQRRDGISDWIFLNWLTTKKKRSKNKIHKQTNEQINTTPKNNKFNLLYF